MTFFVVIIFLIIKINDLFIPWIMISNSKIATLNLMCIHVMNSAGAAIDYGYILAFTFISFIPIFIVGIGFIILHLLFIPNMKIIRSK